MLTLILFVVASLMGTSAGFVYIATFLIDMYIIEIIQDRTKQKAKSEKET